MISQVTTTVDPETLETTHCNILKLQAHPLPLQLGQVVGDFGGSADGDGVAGHGALRRFACAQGQAGECAGHGAEDWKERVVFRRETSKMPPRWWNI